LAEQSDVLVIGSGVAGALIAWSLARAGARVTVIEAGPEVDRGVALARLKRAAIRVPEAPYESAPYAESPATIKDTYIRQDGPDPFRSTYLRLVGGTTWHWLGTALRLLPSDLELRSRYGIGIDWPLAYSVGARRGGPRRRRVRTRAPKALSDAGIARRPGRSADGSGGRPTRFQGAGVAAGSEFADLRRTARVLRQRVVHADLSGAGEVRRDCAS
jgi:glycine/D-amino acid oxidase-like deaminating enzyme